MLASDIRDVNRLQKNANRMIKAARLVEMAAKSNEIADLDLNLCQRKLENAAREMLAMRKRLMK